MAALLIGINDLAVAQEVFVNLGYFFLNLSQICQFLLLGIFLGRAGLFFPKNIFVFVLKDAGTKEILFNFLDLLLG